jgi:signal transduction histidine kinase
MIVFIITWLCKIEGQAIFATASAITMPFTIAVNIMLWLTKGVYARVAAIGMSFAVVGESICHFLIHAKTDTYVLYGGSAYTMAQAGVMIDVFILGYGLSLRAAESDKKLLQTLLENQQIVETERSRLAKDLHDGVGGLLSGIKLTLNSVAVNVPEKNTLLFNKANNQLDNAIREMRRVAHNMMPEALLKFGLGEAIHDFCDGINESNLVKMKYTQIGSLESLDKSTEIVLYRIIQELTNNALKHSGAKNIFIQINKHPKGFTITIEDDGKGFDTAGTAGGGQGLKNVQSRINYLKGSYDIKSEKGNGTSINIEIPN